MKEKAVHYATMLIATVGSASLVYGYHGLGGIPDFLSYPMDFVVGCMLMVPILLHGIYWSKTHKQANYDVLTGILNRASFETRFNNLLGTSCTFQLVMIDLVRFKEINDTYGHRTGDEVLKIVAKRLSESIRPGDIVARLGGDEFVALIKGKPDDLLYVNLIKQVEADMLILNTEMKISINVGITTYPDNSTDHSTLMHQADHAMYQAKRSNISMVRSGSE